jgi:hypothetical protein
MIRLNQLEAMASEIAESFEPATRRRTDGAEWSDPDPDAIAQYQAACDLKKLVHLVKSSPDLLTQVVRALAA